MDPKRYYMYLYKTEAEGVSIEGRGGNVTKKTEIRVRWPQVKAHEQPPENGRDSSLLESPKAA